VRNNINNIENKYMNYATNLALNIMHINIKKCKILLKIQKPGKAK